MRHAVGVDRIMWGSDYPHKESSFPFSREALRLSFAGVDPAEVQAMLGGNAARLFGFDLDALAPVAARVGPTHEEIDRPLPAERDPARGGPMPGLRRGGRADPPPSVRHRPTDTDCPIADPTRGGSMGTVRYGARSEDQLRNREVEATSVDVWATTLVATYLTDPEVVAAVLPPPHRAR